ncbi:uncharacterized protein [Atheta coriaria]|uniref:uncharacterized protein isoform X1 n=2 Tax=Dalotia coriaria TaxID=877792 RepID=UPI0031F4311E
MATEEDRSLHSSMSLPMWMRGRGRMHTKLDFDQSTFSPPENDDNFLYIRYPVKQPPPQQDTQTILVNDQGGIKLDISKHTEPCKDYILGKTNPSKAQVVNGNGQLKSAGTDDGFKSPEASACGTSVIRVASQMVSGKVVKGFETFEDEEKEHMRAIGFDPHLRRGSRSLPASPLQSPNSSPKSKRKHGNKYFTNSPATAGAYADDKKPGSILAGLLAKRDMSRSVTSIAEEQQTVADAGLRLSFLQAGDTSAAGEKKSTAKAKPSHLREMNFWSPTSM